MATQLTIPDDLEALVQKRLANGAFANAKRFFAARWSSAPPAKFMDRRRLAAS